MLHQVTTGNLLIKFVRDGFRAPVVSFVCFCLPVLYLCRVEIVNGSNASDGSFTKELAVPSSVPVELGIQGTWTGSHDFWDKWVDDRVSA